MTVIFSSRIRETLRTFTNVVVAAVYRSVANVTRVSTTRIGRGREAARGRGSLAARRFDYRLERFFDDDFFALDVFDAAVRFFSSPDARRSAMARSEAPTSTPAEPAITLPGFCLA